MAGIQQFAPYLGAALETELERDIWYRISRDPELMEKIVNPLHPLRYDIRSVRFDKTMKQNLDEHLFDSIYSYSRERVQSLFPSMEDEDGNAFEMTFGPKKKSIIVDRNFIMHHAQNMRTVLQAQSLIPQNESNASSESVHLSEGRLGPFVHVMAMLYAPGRYFHITKNIAYLLRPGNLEAIFYFIDFLGMEELRSLLGSNAKEIMRRHYLLTVAYSKFLNTVSGGSLMFVGEVPADAEVPSVPASPRNRVDDIGRCTIESCNNLCITMDRFSMYEFLSEYYEVYVSEETLRIVANMKGDYASVQIIKEHLGHYELSTTGLKMLTQHMIKLTLKLIGPGSAGGAGGAGGANNVILPTDGNRRFFDF